MNVESQRPIDVSKLSMEQLAANPNVSDKDKIAAVSRQFEAILVRQIMSEGQKTVFPSAYVSQGVTSSIYQDMVNTQLADKISQAGTLGLGKTIARQLSHQCKTEKPKPAVDHPPAPSTGLRAPTLPHAHEGNS